MEREGVPAALPPLPVERRLPAARLHQVPPGGKPELRPLVAAILDEADEVPVRHRVRGDLERLQPHAMARHLVVEPEAAAIMADVVKPAGEGDPARLARPDRSQGPLLLVRRPERVARQQVLEVGEDELLVLLLVLQAQLEQLGRVRLAREQILDGKVDMASIRENGVEARARKKAALRTRMALADRLVVGVEEHPEGGIENAIAAHRLEQEGLEKPRGVSEVPLHRARVGHGLQRAILGRQRRGEREAGLSDGAVARGNGERCGDAVALHGDLLRRGLRVPPRLRRPLPA